MATFRNTRRGRFRGGDRNFKRNNGDTNKFKSDFSTNTNFQRKAPGRNNHNAPKLIEKYNDLAREALANGDKILSENYFQHADHFMRVIDDKNKNRIQSKVESKPLQDNNDLSENTKSSEDQSIEEKK